jgi:hypothetical protein
MKCTFERWVAKVGKVGEASATVETRPDGKWNAEARIDAGFDSDHATREGFDTKRAAQRALVAKLRELADQIERGE